jgi:hypothetical protein
MHYPQAHHTSDSSLLGTGDEGSRPQRQGNASFLFPLLVWYPSLCSKSSTMSYQPHSRDKTSRLPSASARAIPRPAFKGKLADRLLDYPADTFPNNGPLINAALIRTLIRTFS